MKSVSHFRNVNIQRMVFSDYNSVITFYDDVSQKWRNALTIHNDLFYFLLLFNIYYDVIILIF